MNERTRAREKAERRALALKKLAKVFGTNGGDTDDGKAAHTAEKKILTEILRSTLEPNVVGLVRDRLAVLSARDDSDESDEDYDVASGEPGAGRDRRNPKPADPRELKTVFSKQWTAAALRDIAKGAREVPATLASGAFWEKLLVTHAPELEHLTSARGDGGAPKGVAADATRGGGDGEGAENADAPAREPASFAEASANDRSKRSLWSVHDLRSESFDLHEQIVERGYAVVPRPECFATATAEIRRDAWTETLSSDGDETAKPLALDDLADAMDALRLAGGPPVAVFAFDAAWTVIDRLFPVAARALDADVGDVRLEPTCFAWALRSAELAASEGSLAAKTAAATAREALLCATRFFAGRRLLRLASTRASAATPSRRRTATIPRRRPGATTSGPGALPVASGRRSWCASGCPSQTPRSTPGVCTSCRATRTGCSTSPSTPTIYGPRVRRRTAGKPCGFRRAPRARSRRRRGRCAYGPDKQYTTDRRVGSPRATWSGSRAKTRWPKAWFARATHAESRRRARRGGAGRGGRWRARSGSSGTIQASKAFTRGVLCRT